MSALAIGGLGLVALCALILLQIPIGIAMIVVGVVGYALQSGWGPAMTVLAGESAGLLSSVDLATVPLFLMMGTFASAAGFSRDIYRAAACWFGHFRGGLAYSTMGAVRCLVPCAGRPPPPPQRSPRPLCLRCWRGATRLHFQREPSRQAAP